MPSTRSIVMAVVVGTLGGALYALWVTVAEAQGTSVPGMAGPSAPVPGQAGPVTPVPGQAGPVQPAPGQAGPAQSVPGQRGPAPAPAAPTRVADQPAPAPYGRLPRCDAGACDEPAAPDAGNAGR